MFDQPKKKRNKANEKKLNHLCPTAPFRFSDYWRGEKNTACRRAELHKCWERSCSLRFLVLVPGRPQRIGPLALQKLHQHVATEMIPCGSTSCGPPDKADAKARCHRHCVTAALKCSACRFGFMLRQDIKASSRRIRRFFVMERLLSSRRTLQTGSRAVGFQHRFIILS